RLVDEGERGAQDVAVEPEEGAVRPRNDRELDGDATGGELRLQLADDRPRGQTRGEALAQAQRDDLRQVQVRGDRRRKVVVERTVGLGGVMNSAIVHHDGTAPSIVSDSVCPTIRDELLLPPPGIRPEGSCSTLHTTETS